jgi:hypothetical protein
MVGSLQKRPEGAAQRRVWRIVGYGLLIVTIGVASCQALFGATP